MIDLGKDMGYNFGQYGKNRSLVGKLLALRKTKQNKEANKQKQCCFLWILLFMGMLPGTTGISYKPEDKTKTHGDQNHTEVDPEC